MTAYEEIRPDTPRNRGDYDAAHTTTVTPDEDIRTIMINRSAWGAILCGVVTTFFVQTTINLIGIGTGAITLDSFVGTLPFTSALWLIVSGIIAAFGGGLAAGRLTGDPRESTTGWHGFLSWGVSVLLVSFLILMTGIVTSGNAAAVPGIYTSSTYQPGTTPGVNETATLSAPTVTALHNVLIAPPAQADSARLDAAQKLAQDQNIPLEVARTRVQQYEQQYRGTIRSNGDLIANSALTGVAILILGALAAFVGGRVGTVKPTITSDRLRALHLSRAFTEHFRSDS
jgi:hypothetical protein